MARRTTRWVKEENKGTKMVDDTHGKKKTRKKEKVAAHLQYLAQKKYLKGFFLSSPPAEWELLDMEEESKKRKEVVVVAQECCR